MIHWGGGHIYIRHSQNDLQGVVEANSLSFFLNEQNLQKMIKVSVLGA